MCTALDQSVVLVGLLIGEKPVCFSRSEKEKSVVTKFILALEEKRFFQVPEARVAVEGRAHNRTDCCFVELEEMSEVER